MKRLRITIEGKVYDVLVEVIEDPGAALSPAASQATVSLPVEAPRVRASAPAPLTPTVPPSAGGNPDDVACPLTGKVVSIDVKVGDLVEEGAQLVTVEAMKMNTYIFAPRSGRIVAVLVNAGDGVEEGTALLRMG